MSIHDTIHTSENAPMHNPEPPRSGATKPIMLIIAIIGGFILLAVAATAVFSSATSFNRGSANLTADTTGITGVNLEANASEFNLEFSNVSQATLRTDGVNAENWQLRREGDELLVTAPDQWFGWCLFNCNFDENRVTLTLPEELNDGSLNADMDLSAGRLTAHGNFDQLNVELGAGEAIVNGTADALDAQLSAGSARLQLADVQTAEFDVSAGQLTTELTGSAPETVNAEVSAGELNVTLPDTQYAVTSDISAGDLDNQLQTSSGSNHQVHVELSAGGATLAPGEPASGQ
ncbi:MAG TPA: DUF2807 domain-containing protein [Candidatus Yaniella excrementavium]|nr:DUF2807 domain-containing protein [Candidatus Yaniella excrementavium]